MLVINRSDLVVELTKAAYKNGRPTGPAWDMWETCLKAVMKVRPAKVRNETIGRWIPRAPLNPDSNCYCSNCKAEISALKSTYYKFCPECGAEMD